MAAIAGSVSALTALLAGYVFADSFKSVPTGDFWNGAIFASAGNHVLHAMHEVAAWVVFSPSVAMVLGFLIALVFYVLKPTWPKRFVEAAPGFHQFFLNKWYIDELYDRIFVRPVRWLGRIFWQNDTRVIDGFGPDGIAARVKDISVLAHRFQTGYLYHYAFVMLTGIAVFVTVMIAFDRGYL